MKKGTKKAHPRATKLTDEPCYKRPIHGFCYTHFIMNENKNTKLSLSIEQVNYINSLSSEPLLVMDMGTLTVKPANEEHFHKWLKNLQRGGEQ
ncbi:hypothetical protein [Leuconostoc citreum]|uniref:hypothetical protein n=1 Tax=Leuconostoc citreum TaxID=33964 RepID=UPI0032DF924F